jgi:RepB DNA-primase from phage plasmid
MHQAVIYFRALYESGDTLCITTISATETFANGMPLTRNVFVPYDKVISDAGIKRLTKLNQTCHIYTSMCTFKLGTTKRTKDNVERVAHCFIEADERGPEVLEAVHASAAAGELPLPNIVLESSPGKVQCIWNISGFSLEHQAALNKALQMKFGTDPASVDSTRVLRVAGFRNIKPAYDPKPIAKILEHNRSFLFYEPEDFNLPLTLPSSAPHIKADDVEVQQAVEKLEAALVAANMPHSALQSWSGAWKFELPTCAWGDLHTNGMLGDAMVGVQPSGKYFYRCLHSHCADKTWKEFRAHLEARAGKRLKFGKKPAAAKKQAAAGK